MNVNTLMAGTILVFAALTGAGRAEFGARRQPPPSAPEEAAPAPRNPDGSVKLAHCKQVVGKATAAGFIAGRRDGQVVVGPTFYQLSFDYKEALAKAVACSLAGREGYYLPFTMVDYQTNKRVGRWDAYGLRLD